MRDVLVLCYHAVSERWPAALAVTPERFGKQLQILVQRGYRGVSFTEAVLGGAPGRQVAITFDDAYRSVIERARPILDDVQMPATVFVPTAFAGGDEPMSWPGIDRWHGTEHERELLPMSWDELRALAADGWEIGSHTHSHPRLTLIDDEHLAEELTVSKRECERQLGTNCRSIAYPYGANDERVAAAARDAGYEAAAALPNQLLGRPEPHIYPRHGIYRVDGPRRFRLKISPGVRIIRSLPVWAALRREPG